MYFVQLSMDLIERDMVFFEDLVSDEDDDEELFIFVHRKPYTIRPRPNFFYIYDDNEFVIRFRLRKQTVEWIHALIEDDIKPKTNR